MRTPNCPDSAPSSPHFHACHFLLLSGYPTIRPSEPNHTPPGTRTKPIKEPASRCGLVHRAVYSIRRRRPDFCSRGLSAPPNRVNLFQSQRIVSAESITYVSYSAPALYTVDRSESAVVLIRTWLCSASRVQQPHRPVSGIPASPAANRRVLASFRPPCGRVPAHSHAGPPPQRYPIEIRTLTLRNPNHRTLRTVRETHFAKKTPKMRLPMSSQHRNQLKQNGLKVHD
jgi:hypothetical protein